MTEQRSLTPLGTASLLCVWYAGFKSEGLCFFGEGVLVPWHNNEVLLETINPTFIVGFIVLKQLFLIF